MISVCVVYVEGGKTYAAPVYRGNDMKRALWIARCCGGLIMHANGGVIYNAASVREI